MNRHALQVISDDSGSFRWVLLASTDEALRFEAHSHADCDFEDYASALNAGTLALAAADEQPYENEAAVPAGDADCARADVPAT
ncbi:hypothetical protein GT347_16170 [Xylophilus rhododendri]|uniref:Uncharacterized protein n=1 Tax=Xylophilus rhododendri TaxID=2697032 RepID=A0A857J8K6_9BURK|nr:hypothetical protein [Xylophilus rhododendri]QHI99379.1 hypothetical protein GT347_16170 [Xylophilus rhododendri]